MKTEWIFIFLVFLVNIHDVNATTKTINQSEEIDLPSRSIYLLDQVWTTQKNKKINLKELVGSPIVLTMTFASCPGACPLMISDMKNFDAQLNPSEKKKIKYITFSIDPARDTPEFLSKFYKKMKLDSRWTLLTSDSDQVRELAAVLGFSYKDLGDGDYTHSTSLFMISDQGEILSRKERSSDWKEFTGLFRNQIKNKK